MQGDENLDSCGSIDEESIRFCRACKAVIARRSKRR
jgi:hypothetical protein